MRIDFDPKKDQIHIQKHGLSLEVAQLLEWDTVLSAEDERKSYGEQRFIGYGFIEERLHCIVYTYRKGYVRVIGLRKANKRERKQYETLR